GIQKGTSVHGVCSRPMSGGLVLADLPARARGQALVSTGAASYPAGGGAAMIFPARHPIEDCGCVCKWVAHSSTALPVSSGEPLAGYVRRLRGADSGDGP